MFFTIGEVNKNGSTSPFGLMYPDTEGWIFLILHAVGTLINLSFITCSYIFILNSACTYWYYSTPIMTAAQEKEKMDEEKKDTKKDKEPAKEDEAIKDGKIEEKNVEESKKKKKTTVTPVSPVRKITTIYPIL